MIFYGNTKNFWNGRKNSRKKKNFQSFQQNINRIQPCFHSFTKKVSTQQCFNVSIFPSRSLLMFHEIIEENIESSNMEHWKQCNNVYRYGSTLSIEAPDKLFDKELHREGEHAIRVSNVFTASVAMFHSTRNIMLNVFSSLSAAARKKYKKFLCYFLVVETNIKSVEF